MRKHALIAAAAALAFAAPAAAQTHDEHLVTGVIAAAGPRHRGVGVVPLRADRRHAAGARGGRGPRQRRAGEAGRALAGGAYAYVRPAAAGAVG